MMIKFRHVEVANYDKIMSLLFGLFFRSKVIQLRCVFVSHAKCGMSGSYRHARFFTMMECQTLVHEIRPRWFQYSSLF